MTFLQLEYFHAVAESGSISRVAEMYNISPAALSRSISQLERELGVELFDHEGRSIVLNENGRIFLRCTVEIIDSMMVARKCLAEASHSDTVRVRFDVLVDEPGELAIAFKLARPDLVVEIIPPHRTNARYDARLFASASKLQGSQYVHVCEERFVAALPSDHALAGRESIRLADLRDEPFVLYRGDRHEQTVFEMCEEAGFVPRIGMAFGLSAHQGLLRAVATGLGCSIIPERSSRSEWNPSNIALVHLSDVVRTRNIYATTPDGSPMSEGCKFVIDTIMKRMR